MGLFPRYYIYDENRYVPISESEVPPETELVQQKFKLAGPGNPYLSPISDSKLPSRPGLVQRKFKLAEPANNYASPLKNAWTNPGPKAGPFKAKLADGSVVTYYWYRFIDQPAFQQYRWSAEKKEKLQCLVEKIQASWPIDRDYMAPSAYGQLVSIDPALIVTPPPGLEVGYVPVVIRQEPEKKLR
jgi:hypothetical protein